jgi:multidrug efflux system membrane fusion protein
MARSKVWISTLGIVAVCALAGGVAYYQTADSGAKGGKGGEKSAKSGDKKGGRSGGGPVPVITALVALQSMPVKLQAIGNVEPYATVTVKARVDGQIMEVGFREGEEVKAGTVLFRIDPRPYEAAVAQAQAIQQRDIAQLAQADRQEQRYKELLEKNFISKEAYAQYKTAAETAQSAVMASRAQLDNARLQLDYTTIRSPINGYAGKIQIQKGNLVKANDSVPLVVLNQVHPVYVNFAIPEQSLATIRRYMKAGPLAAQALAAGSENVLGSGRLVFVDNQVDPTTGTIRLRAQFENRDNALWPGQFVSLRLNLYEDKEAMVVPASTVQNGPSGQYVYVVKADQSAELRRVEVDRTEGDTVVIAKGLQKDETVVTRGQLRLSPGAKVAVRDPAAKDDAPAKGGEKGRKAP